MIQKLHLPQIIKRFFAHLLEIGVTFSISLILLNILIWAFNAAHVQNFLENEQGVLINIPMGNEGTNSLLTSLNYTIISFILFYFIYTTFNFFFTFSTLYPKNNFEASFAQKIFGFKKYEFKNKKDNHLKKALRMVLREILIVVSVYGVLAIITLTNFSSFNSFFLNLMTPEDSLNNLLVITLNLFFIFVLPSLILSLIFLKISKGKQLFWDYYSGITLK